MPAIGVGERASKLNPTRKQLLRVEFVFVWIFIIPVIVIFIVIVVVVVVVVFVNDPYSCGELRVGLVW